MSQWRETIQRALFALLAVLVVLASAGAAMIALAPTAAPASPQVAMSADSAPSSYSQSCRPLDSVRVVDLTWQGEMLQPPYREYKFDPSGSVLADSVLGDSVAGRFGSGLVYGEKVLLVACPFSISIDRQGVWQGYGSSLQLESLTAPALRDKP